MATYVNMLPKATPLECQQAYRAAADLGDSDIHIMVGGVEKRMYYARYPRDEGDYAYIAPFGDKVGVGVFGADLCQLDRVLDQTHADQHDDVLACVYERATRHLGPKPDVIVADRV